MPIVVVFVIFVVAVVVVVVVGGGGGGGGGGGVWNRLCVLRLVVYSLVLLSTQLSRLFTTVRSGTCFNTDIGLIRSCLGLLERV